MSETLCRFVGGPRGGAMIAIRQSVAIVRGPETVWDDETMTIRQGWPQDREYVRVWRATGEAVFEWHRRGWRPRNVHVIQAVVEHF